MNLPGFSLHLLPVSEPREHQYWVRTYEGNWSHIATLEGNTATGWAQRRNWGLYMTLYFTLFKLLFLMCQIWISPAPPVTHWLTKKKWLQLSREKHLYSTSISNCLTLNVDKNMKINETKPYSFSSPLQPSHHDCLECAERLQGSTDPWENNSPASGAEQGEIRGGGEEEKDELRAWSEGLACAPTCSGSLLKFNALQSLPRTWFYTFAFLPPPPRLVFASEV